MRHVAARLGEGADRLRKPRCGEARGSGRDHAQPGQRKQRTLHGCRTDHQDGGWLCASFDAMLDDNDDIHTVIASGGKRLTDSIVTNSSEWQICTQEMGTVSR
jgi:hypothetical protein